MPDARVARIKPADSKHWLKVKNRKHPAMSRVKEFAA